MKHQGLTAELDELLSPGFSIDMDLGAPNSPTYVLLAPKGSKDSDFKDFGPKDHIVWGVWAILRSGGILLGPQVVLFVYLEP